MKSRTKKYCSIVSGFLKYFSSKPKFLELLITLKKYYEHFQISNPFLKPITKHFSLTIKVSATILELAISSKPQRSSVNPLVVHFRKRKKSSKNSPEYDHIQRMHCLDSDMENRISHGIPISRKYFPVTIRGEKI